MSKAKHYPNFNFSYFLGKNELPLGQGQNANMTTCLHMQTYFIICIFMHMHTHFHENLNEDIFIQILGICAYYTFGIVRVALSVYYTLCRVGSYMNLFEYSNECSFLSSVEFRSNKHSIA